MVKGLLPLLLICVPGVASGSYLTQLADHPNLVINVGVPVKTPEGTFNRACQISWNLEDGNLIFHTRVQKTWPLKPGAKGYHEDFSFIRSSDIASATEILELAKAAEAEMPKFETPTPPAPEGAEDYSLRLAQGADDVSWEVKAIPVSKTAAALQKLYASIYQQLSDEQKVELDKTRPPAALRQDGRLEPQLRVTISWRGNENGLMVERDFDLLFRDGKKRETLSRVSLACREEPLPGESVGLDEKLPYRHETGYANLPKWRLPWATGILAAYDKEAHLGQYLPKPYGLDSVWYCIDRTSGDGRMVSNSYTGCPGSRLDAWKRASDGLKKLLTERQIRVLDTPAKLL